MASFDYSKLEDLLSNENVTRNAAEEYLEAAKSYNPQAFVSCIFSHSLDASVAEPIRVLCLTIMRNQARQELRAILTGGGESVGVFKSLGSSDIDRLRQELFTCIQNEDSKLYFMKKLADFMISFNNIHSWESMVPEVCGLMRTTSNPSTLQTCIYSLQKLLENSVEGVDEHSTLLSSVISVCLQDANLKTKSMATQLFISFVYRFDVGTAIPEAEMNYCLTILAETISSDEEEALSILSSIHNLADAKAGIFESVWGNLFQLLVSIIQGDSIDDEQIKIESIECLTVLITNEQSKFCHTQECREGVAKLLMTLMIQKDDEVDTDFWAVRPNDYGEFYDEGSNISNISAVAAESFEKISNNICTKANGYYLPLCLQFVQEQLGMDDGRNKRGGLLILYSLCECAYKSLYPMITSIAPAVLSLVSNESLDVQYAALNCLDKFISKYSDITEIKSDSDDDEEVGGDDGENEEVEDDDDEALEEKKGIQELFPEIIPQCLIQHLQYPQVISTPKILHLTLKCLAMFFDPDCCDKKIGKPFSKPLLEYCDSLLINENSLIFCREIAAVLIGRVSLFSTKKVMKTYYSRIMSIFKTILTYEPTNFQSLIPVWSGLYSVDCTHSLGIELSKFKGASLRAITIVGSSVGPEVFYNDAVEMIGTLIQSQSSESVDYTDPLFVDILVSCARIAQVIKDNFAQFVPHVIPPLLKFISSPLSFISEESDFNGGVNNTSEVQARLQALNCMYQYMMDIPSLISQIVPDILQAVCSLIRNPQLPSDFYLCGFQINFEGLKAYLFYSTQSAESQAIAQRMLNANLEILLEIHKEERSVSMNNFENDIIACLVDSLRELLVVINDDRESVRSWQLTIEESSLISVMAMLKQEFAHWFDRNSEAENLKDEVMEMEGDMLSWLGDSFMWVVKLYGRAGADAVFIDLIGYVQSLIPLVDGKENSNYVTKVKELILRVHSDAFENMDMSEAIASWPSIMATAALRFIDVDDCIVPSIYTIGSLSDALVASIVSNQQNEELLLNFFQFFRVLLYASNRIPVESCPRLWDPDMVDSESRKEIVQTSTISLFALCFSVITHNPTSIDFSIPSSHGWPDVHVDAPLLISDILTLSTRALKKKKVANLYDIKRFHSILITHAKTFTPALFGDVSNEKSGNLILVMELIVQLLLKIGNPDSADVLFWDTQFLSERSYLEAKAFLKDVAHGRSAFPSPVLAAHFGQLSAEAQDLLSKVMSNPDF